MHGLLAMSALHFAHVNAGHWDAYLITSAHHQACALDFFSTRLTDMNEHDCDEYLLLAVLIFVLTTYAITNPHGREGGVTPDIVVQSFVILQGKP